MIRPRTASLLKLQSDAKKVLFPPKPALSQSAPKIVHPKLRVKRIADLKPLPTFRIVSSDEYAAIMRKKARKLKFELNNIG